MLIISSMLEGSSQPEKAPREPLVERHSLAWCSQWRVRTETQSPNDGFLAGCRRPESLGKQALPPARGALESRAAGAASGLSGTWSRSGSGLRADVPIREGKAARCLLCAAQGEPRVSLESPTHRPGLDQPRAQSRRCQLWGVGAAEQASGPGDCADWGHPSRGAKPHTQLDGQEHLQVPVGGGATEIGCVR